MEKIQLALQKARENRDELDDRAPVRLQRQLQRPAKLIEVGDLDAISSIEFSPRALERYKAITTLKNQVAVEAFRVLRTQILHRVEALGGQLMAVTSPWQGEGKTFVSLNLSIALARQLNRGAILIDADIRRPALHRHLARTPEGQTSDVLTGKKTLAECLLRTNLDDLMILPQSKSVQRSSELLASEEMHALAATLREYFPDRLVIFDAPPLLATDDALVLQRLVDAMLLVIQEGQTSQADLGRAVQLIDEKRFLGCIVNNAKWHKLPSYYY